MAVAARDRHPRLREPELWTDDVHDALLHRVGEVQLDAEFFAVALERHRHFFRHHVQKRTALRAGGHDVIDRRDCALGKCYFPSVLPHHVERLRAGDFVNQVQTDEQLRLSARQRAHLMCVPHLVKKRVSHVTSNDSGRMRR